MSKLYEVCIRVINVIDTSPFGSDNVFKDAIVAQNLVGAYNTAKKLATDMGLSPERTVYEIRPAGVETGHE